MPENTVYVGRPTRWGNPFPMSRFGREGAYRFFDNAARGIWYPFAAWEAELDFAYRAHQEWTRRIGGHPTEAAVSELRGKNLACWCPLSSPCHADVLLELANKEA